MSSVSPLPEAEIAPSGTPLPTRLDLAALARHSESFWLYFGEPTVSVWPTIVTLAEPPDLAAEAASLNTLSASAVMLHLLKPKKMMKCLGFGGSAIGVGAIGSGGGGSSKPYRKPMEIVCLRSWIES